MKQFFRSRQETCYPAYLYELVFDLFAIVQQWSPAAEPGVLRGRQFEQLLVKYSGTKGLPLSERPGARTVRGTASSSGLLHETDAVYAFPDITVQFELKHLTSSVSKNDLLIFNQKGLDFLCASDRRLRRLPLYRIFLSGGVLSNEARRFAVQWGISVIEPDRLPLLFIHWLAGKKLAFAIDGVSEQDLADVWETIPAIMAPLQSRLKRAAQVLDSEEPLLGDLRMDWSIDVVQRVWGDYLWNALDEHESGWLDEKFDEVVGYVE